MPAKEERSNEDAMPGHTLQVLGQLGEPEGSARTSLAATANPPFPQLQVDADAVGPVGQVVSSCLHTAASVCEAADAAALCDQAAAKLLKERVANHEPKLRLLRDSLSHARQDDGVNPALLGNAEHVLKTFSRALELVQQWSAKHHAAANTAKQVFTASDVTLFELDELHKEMTSAMDDLATTVSTALFVRQEDDDQQRIRRQQEMQRMAEGMRAQDPVLDAQSADMVQVSLAPARTASQSPPPGPGHEQPQAADPGPGTPPVPLPSAAVPEPRPASARQRVAIGIDLGTSSCSVGFVNERGDVEIVVNEHGQRRTPSCVAATGCGQCLVGRAAVIQEFEKLAPFRVHASEEGCATEAPVQLQGEARAPEAAEITAMVLRQLRRSAELTLGPGFEVGSAVIAVPSHFNTFQRADVRSAARAAGLAVARLIQAPDAVALALTHPRHAGLLPKARQPGSSSLVVVFDLGAGTCSACLACIEERVVEVCGSAGRDVGGEDMCRRLVEHVVVEFSQANGKDPKTDATAMNRLHLACEAAMVTLSSAATATLQLDALMGIDFVTDVTRSKFEELNADLFDSCMAVVERCMSGVEQLVRDCPSPVSSKMQKSQVNEVFVVGGGSRIPRVQQLLRSFFDGKELNLQLLHDEAVAAGAALQAALMSAERGGLEQLRPMLLLDATPCSLGVQGADGAMEVLICRCSTVPTWRSREFTTVNDAQPKALIRVFEGEHVRAQDNRFLGEFYLPDIPPAPRGTHKVLLRMDINSNSSVVVSAKLSANGHGPEDQEGWVRFSLSGERPCRDALEDNPYPLAACPAEPACE